MTDLRLLDVSLTKYKAHKVARLLKDYPTDQLMGRLKGLRIDPPQTRKNLSLLPGDVFPPIWDRAKALGDDAVDGLLLVGIVFSHHRYIAVLRGAEVRRGGERRVARDALPAVKEFTNLRRIFDQLGYATQVEFSGFNFSFRQLFQIPGLSPLVNELLGLKLKAAGWDGRGDVGEEAVRVGFAEVFGVSATELKAWLALAAPPAGAGSHLTAKDQDFFETEADEETTSPFVFRAGHEPREVEPVPRRGSPRTVASQLHNRIQNGLHAHLVKVHGASRVGTELDTGAGASIDLVTRVAGRTTFYEIKTSRSVRANIRQALPQLLEYAYWPEEDRAEELVIVSHLPLTPSGRRYLQHLRDRFRLPLSYRRFDLEIGELV